MDNVTIEDNCDCPMECNSISYSFTVVSTPFDAAEMCPSEMKKGNFMKEFYKNKFPSQFIRRLAEFRNNISSDAVEYCKKNLNYRAEIIFKMATDSLSVTVMSRRLTFFDKMSAFGSDK